MKREKNLFKNTIIIAIGKLSSKFFSFLLLPLYTSVLLPEDYGIVDVLQTCISLIIYIVTLQIESAIFRFIIDDRSNENRNKDYVSTGMIFVLINLIFSTGIILIINLIHSVNHLPLFILCIWSESICIVFRNISRGLGHNGLYSIANFMITLISLLTNIILILGMKMGAESILIAFFVSNIVGSIILFWKEKAWIYFSFKRFSKKKLKEMLEYSIPLVPNAISWWIANASDRMLILYFLGSAMNGIYAVANKIPTIYTTIFNVYNLAWGESVALAAHDDDRDQFVNSIMDKSYRMLSFLALGIICCMSLFFKLLVKESYVAAYYHIYILLVAIFVNSMCSMYGGIFAAFKSSKVLGRTTIIGAMINLIINIALINSIGLYAASISTLISYVAIFVVRKFYADKLVKVHWSKSFSVQVIVTFAIVTAGYFSRKYLINIAILIALIIWGVINNKEIAVGIINMAKEKLHGRMKGGAES